ncbi:transporter substrate-binding domain-containing protein [Agrobacterium sp. MOPV5]|uniref:transporter substrate-binding domain-containing protein n=1 Tax=Agrobacterium leguminum TaxID=2792015 RepID=UPI0018C270E1|nr:transporter substrate-binding domain-containing protein [Agrobacterium leguminum]MBG0511122.1 transporter substrate-binding domain-containing protein [Agrobacterium leguminum]
MSQFSVAINTMLKPSNNQNSDGGAFPPWNAVNTSGKPVGFDIVGTALCERAVCKKKNEKLADRFNDAIWAIAKDGTLKEMSLKWFGADLVSR